VIPALTVEALARLVVGQERLPSNREALLDALFCMRRLVWQPRPYAEARAARAWGLRQRQERKAA